MAWQAQVAIVVVVSLALAVGVWWLVRRTRDADRRADLEADARRRAEHEADTAEARRQVDELDDEGAAALVRDAIRDQRER